MTGSLRVGGRALLADGETLVWSVAEGSRGRRWREAIIDGAGLRRSLLLEVSLAGVATRLEMTTRAGLLTLHPSDAGRELHGNVVTATGIRHLRFDWSGEHELYVSGSPAAASVVLQRLAGIVGAGEGRQVLVVRVDDILEPRPGAWHATRTATDTWQLRDSAGPEENTVRLDDDGIAVEPDAERWPLELE